MLSSPIHHLQLLLSSILCALSLTAAAAVAAPNQVQLSREVVGGYRMATASQLHLFVLVLSSVTLSLDLRQNEREF